MNTQESPHLSNALVGRFLWLLLIHKVVCSNHLSLDGSGDFLHGESLLLKVFPEVLVGNLNSQEPVKILAGDCHKDTPVVFMTRKLVPVVPDNPPFFHGGASPFDQIPEQLRNLLVGDDVLVLLIKHWSTSFLLLPNAGA